MKIKCKIPKLTKICSVCNGIGYTFRYPKKQHIKTFCNACFSRGHNLTKYGRTIIKLVKDYKPWDAD